MLKGMAAAVALQPDFLFRLATNAAASIRVQSRPPQRRRLAERGELGQAERGGRRQSHQRACPVRSPRDRSQGRPCVDALANIKNPFYPGDQPGGTQVSGGLDAWTPASSAYEVKALSNGDVAAAANFARDNNLRLVVKGAGHEGAPGRTHAFGGCGEAQSHVRAVPILGDRARKCKERMRR